MIALRDYQASFVNDALNAYRKGATSICGVLPCGAGKTVIAAKLAQNVISATGKNVLFLVHRRELVKQTADSFRRLGVDMQKARVCMVQTLCRKPRAVSNLGLIITDEGHHAKAQSYEKIYRDHKNVRKIMLTATPQRLDGKGLGDVCDCMVQGVDAEWLINHGYLSNYKYFAPNLIDASTLKKSRGEYTVKSIDKAFEDARIYGNVVRYYRQLAGGKQAILYAASIAQSKKNCKKFLDENVSAAHIDGNTPKAERDEIIKKFRDRKIQVLCNVDIVGEGFDVPDCEAVILLRPTVSLALHIQQSMRCMRYEEGKTAIIIDHVNNRDRHGLPDDKREWTLDGMQSKRRDEKLTRERICPSCFLIIPYDTSIETCPHCGFTFPKRKAKELKTDESVELVEVSRKIKIGLGLKPEECTNVEELKAVARERGYKSGWVYFQQKARGWI